MLENRYSIFIIWITNLHIVFGCPYSSYNQAVLPIENHQTIHLFSFEEYSLNNFISIGYWTFSIPYFFLQYYPIVEMPFEENIIEDGQFISLIKFDVDSKILNYVYFDFYKQTVDHVFTFLNQEQDDINFEYPMLQYESLWYFTLITFDTINNKIFIQLTDQDLIIVDTDLTRLTQIILGGRGNIDTYNLNIFKGRISQLYTSYDDQQFLLIQDMCKIPNEIQGQQKIMVVDGLKYFDGPQSISTSFKQVGNYYLLSGWVRYDVSRIITNAYFTLIRISIFLNYNFVSREGDEIFIIQTSINKQSTQLSNVFYIQDFHTYPIYGVDFNTNLEDFYSLNNLFYEALQSWHFVKIEYSLTSAGGQTHFQIQFSNEIGTIYRLLNGKTITNTIYYVYFGNDLINSDFLKGDVYDFSIIYNYEEPKFYQIDQCHYSCSKCNGPLYNNCIECQSDQNREYFNDSQTCPCKYGFIDKGLTKCENFFQEFYQVQQQESLNEISMNCQFGYFIFPVNSISYICIECPQKSNLNYLCVDCIHNLNNWYSNPICKEDLIKFDGYSDGAYVQKFRKDNDIDLYFIDLQGQLTLHPGYMSFCDSENDDSSCHLSNFKHLDKETFVKCKPNYFYADGQCQFSNSFCLEVNAQGICQTKIDGMYELNGQYYQCPINCLQCSYNLQQIECENCIQGYGLLNGQCIQCGMYCQTCQNYFDINQQQSYLKCYQCIDSSHYFISFDAINCQENTIQNCQYAFQAVKDNLYFNTLDLYFIPRNDSENLQIYCARCDYNYIFVFSNSVCLFGSNENCDFGYAEQIYEISLDSTTQALLLEQKQIEYNGMQIYYAQNSDGEIIYTSQQICIIQAKLQDSTVQFTQDCVISDYNCKVCILGQRLGNSVLNSCLGCKPGYYLDRITSRCKICPSDMNCFQCYQQQIQSQDYWKKDIRAFYKALIEGLDQAHPFVDYGQSQKQDEYQVLCSTCQKGYILNNNVCIPYCTEKCLDCLKIDNQFLCAKCPLLVQGRMITTINNDCIQCPENCSLCRQRAKSEISLINPLFSNTEIDISTYQCLKSFENQNYYYDNFLGRFIDCKLEEKCQYTFVIEMNLYCESDEYNKDLQYSIQNNEENKFKKQNILFENLISGQSFSEFENEQFFNYANQKTIKTIVIHISSDNQQNCQVNIIDGVIKQSFGQNIFTAINVEIELSFKFQMTMYLNKTLQFQNFKKVTLSNLSIISIQNNRFKQIIFTSIYPQEIYCYQITFQQQILSYDSSQYIFNNVQKLVFDDFIIQNVMQNNASIFFQISGSENQQKNIQIKNLSILNSILNNLILLSLEKNKDGTVVFENWNINGEFENFTTIYSDSSSSLGNIIISQIGLFGRIEENEKFYNNFVIKDSIIFKLIGYDSLLVNHIHIQKSEFINSILFSLCDNSDFNQIIVENSILMNSTIFFNSNQTIQETTELSYRFENMKFLNILYDETSKFLNLKRYISKKQNLFAQFLIIQGNKITNFTESFNQKSFQSALLYFELDYVGFQNVSVYRSYGLVEISIYDPKRLLMQQVLISQNNLPKTLYQSLTCLLSHQIEQISQPSLTIFSAIEVEIFGLTINKTSIFNNPIIYYQSADITDKEQFEKITIENTLISNNILLQTKSNVNLALFYLLSNQQTFINFSNITFTNNILNAQTQDYQEMSALLLNIDATQGNMTIMNSFFIQNVIFNTSNSIFYIKLRKIELINCEFNGNNVFIYENIRNHLVWSFYTQDPEGILSDDLSEIFKIISSSGNGVYIAQELYISNIRIQNSQGSFGGAFQMFPLLNSLIKVQNLEISQTSTLFIEQNEGGGGIYLDSSLCQTLEIEFRSIVVYNIKSRYYGGLLYFQSGTGKVNISISNVQVQNSFALIGSVFCFMFSTDNQYLFLSNISIKNSEENFLAFHSKFGQQQLSQNETELLLNNRTLIYILSGNQMILQNIEINSIILEAALVIVKSINIQIFDLILFNCSASWNQILIQPDQNLLTSIFLNNIQISNLSNMYNPSSFSCVSNNKLQNNISFFCPQNIEDAPNHLNFYLQDSRSENCFLYQTLNSIAINFISIIYISEFNDRVNLQFEELTFSNISCNTCQYGIIGLIFSSDSVQNNYSVVENLSIINAQCGQKGCLVILRKQTQTTINLNRQLSNDQFYLTSSNKYFIINRFICLNNTSTNGPCIYLQNIQLLLSECIFSNNTSQENGGSIYIEGTEEFILQKSIIENNTAQIGGGLMLQNQQDLIYKSLNSLLIQNVALISGNDTISLPSQLSITLRLDEWKLQTKTVFENKKLTIDIITETVYLPSGQKLAEYQIFNLSTRTYLPSNLQFRILALNTRNNIMQNLDNTFCSISSRIYNSTNQIDDNLFFTNFTSYQSINFNSTTKDYNLDDLIIYFDNNSPKELFLQLQFMCNSVWVPQYSELYPYNIIASHQNYQLRINIRSFPCQYGEIKNNTDQSCTKCDGGQDQFSLVLNADKCELKDDISTISVTSVKLNLRPYYWRPYFDASIISYCQNLPSNCLGGWVEGDESCYIGHIGALCQSCDIYNIRGQGYYSVSDKYKCSSCTDKQLNIVIVVIVSLWMFLSTYISVQSTNQTIQQNIRFLNIRNISSKYITIKQSAKLLKLFTNYLQIIGSLSSLQLQIPYGLQLAIFSLSSPTKQTVYSIDCFLKDFMSIQIQYARIIWQILSFGIYVNGFFICYIFFTILKRQKFNSSVISTSLIYIYIYIQPGLIAGFIELISSSTISGYKWILANVAFRYDTDYHRKWMLEFCLPMIILLAIIIPLFLFFCLYYNREVLEKKSVQSKYGYLFLDYKRKSYFWEIIKIAEKELITLFLTYYEDNVIANAILTQIILIIYLELNQQSKPYTTLQLNQIDYFSTQVCFISLSLSIGIYITNEQNYPEIKIPFSVILILINAFLIINFIVNFFVEYFNEELGFLSARLDFIRDYFRKEFPFLNKISFLQKILENKKEKKERIDYLFKKLKPYLRNQAKEIIIIKKLAQLQSFQALQHSKIRFDLEQRYDSIPQSIRSKASQDINLIQIHKTALQGQRENQIAKRNTKMSIQQVNSQNLFNLEQFNTQREN